ncbi:ABC transporter substrate-binding protein [Rhizobium giardinii]|uniref:ABC transporter substrate-binding protein n=1 Tax=Rhizobium giardinii TaxID=56731 RepID=UPI0004762C5F
MLKLSLMTLPATSFMAGAAQADIVKVGVIAPMTGPKAIFGKQFTEALAVYQKQNGTKVGEHEVEFVIRDLPDINPGQARALAQELVIQEDVQYLAGFEFTPNAMAVAPILERANVPLVIFNAATSAIVGASPYALRTSYTTPQVTVPVADCALRKGMKKVVVMVSDYGPGIDAERAFTWRFQENGGEIIDTIRMSTNTTDFSPMLQRARNAKPDAIYIFLPAGPSAYAFMRAYVDNHLAGEGIKLLGTAETDETMLQELGDPAIGIHTAYHYSQAHSSPENDRFTRDLKALFPKAEANFASVGAYDGAHVIYKMIEATNGRQDAAKAVEAVKGLEWVSPRGSVKIDPESRGIIQNVYMRVVEKNGEGRLINTEIETFPMQPDWGHLVPKQ